MHDHVTSVQPDDGSAGEPHVLAHVLVDHEPDAEQHHSLWQRIRRTRTARYLLLNPLNLFGLVIIVVFTVLAVAGPWLAPYSPTLADFNFMLSAPSGTHWFGTDPTGYDIFSRILAGAQLSMGAAAAILGLAVVIGLPLGAISGYAGGWLDEIIMRVTDMFLAFPALILALAVAQSMGIGLQNAVIALSMGFWPWYARLLRGQVLSLKHKEYVEAARAVGVSNTGIMWRHILPNALGPIVVEFSQDMGFAILEISALSFIGLGAQKPSPEWGAMINASLDSFRNAWWTCAFPGLAITLVVLGFNLVGDGLRDALDPRAANAPD
jgi:peptide/nickel transport system permease protein